MGTFNSESLGRNLASARKAAGLTQAALAQLAGISRVQVVRTEAGLTVPRLDEAGRLAEALKVPLEFLTEGRFTPTQDLRGIALELNRLGIRDLVVSGPRVPGTFRHKEELLVLAVSGDRPEPRVLEAVPYLLLRRHFLTPLVGAFAEVFDKRAQTRLAWLSEIAIALTRLGALPVFPFSPLLTRTSPLRFVEPVHAAKKPTEPDSLGRPATGKVPPIWRRWNVTYAGTLDDFLRRTIEVHEAFEATRNVLGDEL